MINRPPPPRLLSSAVRISPPLSSECLPVRLHSRAHTIARRRPTAAALWPYHKRGTGTAHL
jgi:hypothetical protein